MGLDMYLNANRYLWSYPADGKDARVSKAVAELCEVSHKVKEITIEAAYWRKANHIHKWFVDNVQNGEDDCGTYDVTREQLAVLLATVKQVKAERVKAAELLPTQGGFFFGSTEYDDGYEADLDDTEKQLTAALALPDSWYFQYHSSW